MYIYIYIYILLKIKAFILFVWNIKKKHLTIHAVLYTTFKGNRAYWDPL